ncbi:adenylate/guanylate cyclase domain-containing protein [Desulfogranum japonicum]|uniref:adenylate/guanylate cyclase domain-containing protein n=1 Tax=Desulfogranum japonicum TaxID=231447 RepID=UPI00048AF508|nr:adenylate/guanylate cyclase domain-containing protein [Desulfogranum japonicum]
MVDQQARILVVEDSPVNQRLLCALLEKQGYDVTAVGSGIQALTYLQTTPFRLPDLILLDIIMPEMNGFDFCKYLKKNKSLEDIPVIFISSLGSASDKLHAFNVGGVDYITKPFHPGEVMARIATHLKLCKLQRQLEEKNRQLQVEKQKSEGLLRNVLPIRVAQELIQTGECRPQSFDPVTVCFVDIVNFTRISSSLPPETVIQELNDIFTAFDAITHAHQCERMKTIGDAYLCATGIPEPDARHAHKMAEVSLDMIDFMVRRNLVADLKWEIRIGLHTGKVVGGIVGTDKYLFDIFGDTVNIASRIESLSLPMYINVSDELYLLLENDFLFSDPRSVHIKGKGLEQTYFLLGRIPESCNESI